MGVAGEFQRMQSVAGEPGIELLADAEDEVEETCRTS